jgi:histone H2A
MQVKKRAVWRKGRWTDGHRYTIPQFPTVITHEHDRESSIMSQSAVPFMDLSTSPPEAPVVIDLSESPSPVQAQHPNHQVIIDIAGAESPPVHMHPNNLMEMGGFESPAAQQPPLLFNQQNGVCSRKSNKSKSISQSARASGLVFPYGRIRRVLKKQLRGIRVDAGAPLYMSAILQYLLSEVIELAGNAAKDDNKKRIMPRHIMLALRNDEELNKLTKNATLRSSGVFPELWVNNIEIVGYENDIFYHNPVYRQKKKGGMDEYFKYVNGKKTNL